MYDVVDRLVVVQGEKKREIFVSSDRKRLGEEIGDILKARKMLDDKLALSDPIANPVEAHDLDIFCVTEEFAMPTAHSLSQYRGVGG